MGRSDRCLQSLFAFNGGKRSEPLLPAHFAVNVVKLSSAFILRAARACPPRFWSRCLWTRASFRGLENANNGKTAGLWHSQAAHQYRTPPRYPVQRSPNGSTCSGLRLPPDRIDLGQV